jgi:catalase
MENTVKTSIQSRRVAIIAADGYNHEELMAVKTALKNAGAQAEIVAKVLGTLKSSSGESVEVDKTYLTTASLMYDALFIPGGQQSVQTLQTQGDARHFVNEAFTHGKTIGAASEAIDLLARTDIEGIAMADAQSQERIIVNQGVVTGRNGMALDAFTQHLIEAIAQHRHWDREEKDKVPA